MDNGKKPGQGGSGSPTSRNGPIVETGRSKINRALPTGQDDPTLPHPHCRGNPCGCPGSHWPGLGAHKGRPYNPTRNPGASATLFP